MKKNLILHITPHLPGGLERVLLSTLKYSNKENSPFLHEIIILDEKHLTNHTKKKFLKYNKFIHIRKEYDFIKKKICEADIVQVEYWNHPQIYEFLTNFRFPLCRLVLCSHVNGFSRPQIITKNAVDFSDIFLSTTKATRKHPLFISKKNIDRKKKLKFVNYPVDFKRFGKITPKPHNEFNISYIGSLNYSKLHKDFLKMSDAINLPKTNIIICGSGADRSKIKKEAKKYTKTKFQFKGFVENIKNILKITDVLGYPLNKNHYGSGEQIIIEAMYSKIPIVAFANCAEKEIIQNKKTGILVKNKDDYVQAIKYLYNNPKKRKKIGLNAHRHILTHLSPLVSFKNLNKVYKKLMSSKKKFRKFKTRILKKDDNKNFGSELFIESLGTKGREFLKSYKNSGKKINEKINEIIKNAEIELKVLTKGSLFQYLYFYPNDPYLNFWAGLMSLNEKNIFKKNHKPLNKSSYNFFRKALKFDKKNKEFQYYLKRNEIKKNSF